MSKLYTVEATFKGRILLKVRADSRSAAVKAFELDANEDEREIIKEIDCVPQWDTMKEYP